MDKNFDSVEYLKQKIGSKDTIYAYDHFYYLMLNKNLPTNVIHPSLIRRLDRFKNIYGVKNSTEEELSKIFEKDLDWLIIRKDMFGKGMSLKAEVTNGNCPLCHERTVFVSLYTNVFICTQWYFQSSVL